MKTRIVQCNINYESWQMQCCGDPIHVGQVVNLSCIKDKPYTCACGIDIDFDEEHHDRVPNCFIRGKVKRIRLFVLTRSTKTSKISDMVKSWTTFCCLYADKNVKL